MKELNIISCGNRFESMWDNADEPYFRLFRAYKENRSYFLSLVHKVWKKIGFPLEQIWFSDTVRDLSGYCVVMDAEASVSFLKWFRDNNPKAKLLFFYWNSVESHCIQPDIVKKMGYEAWSFDPDDCIEYDMHLNREFFCSSWYDGIEEVEPQYDIIFIGRDKNGRMDLVKSIKEKYDEYGLKWKLYFTANKWWQYFLSNKYSKYLRHNEMLQMQMEARCILDYSQTIQGTITNRTFDALVNHRKVMTNNMMIKSLNIYSRENCYIIDDDSPNRLVSFINEPFHQIDTDVLRSHSAERWAKTFTGEWE